jgi:TolB-like protein/Tfp pilus assembly protein PilF
MNEKQSVEPKVTQPVCARCGSQLSSSENTKEFCVACLLHTALGGNDVDHAARRRRFDQYELVTDSDGAPVELGRGAMGVTYKAFDTNLRCEVALKVIHPRFLADESSRARFLSEARAAAQLRHRNIASVFHLGSERGEYFYAMELVEGETVESRIRRKGPIDCATALDIALQITRALIATGSRQFVHRDVKPSNVMLCTEADGAIVAKLIDFGLVRGITEQFARATASPARQFVDRRNPSRRTAGGSDGLVMPRARIGFIGTPHFASPEQFGGETTDARSDIFSLGVTLWFMLTGKLLFDGTRDEIRRKQISGALPLDQLKGIPRAVVGLIKHMLDVDPAQRPQSSGALKEQLHKCIAAIDTAKQKQRRRFAYSALAAASIIIGTLAASYIFQRKVVSSSAGEIVPDKSIAVLPFANRIREPDGAYFVDGIRSQIVARLVKIAKLKVVSGSPTQRYQSTPENPAQVAEELGVADILQGSVEKQGEKFRIAVRLIDGKKNVDLWSKSYDRTFAKIVELESDVARQAAVELRLKLTEPEKRVIDKPATSNPRAYDAYLKGRYVWLQRNYDSFQQAKEYFEQAIALDPSYAKAYAGLADAYQFLAVSDPRSSKENYEKARSAYKRALELEPTLAEAHASAGLVAMNYDWDWPLAEQELRRAIALGPNEALFYDWYAEYLMAVGRTDESLANMERARELDASSVLINSDLGKLLWFARRYDEAEPQLKETLLMDPNFTQAHWWLGLTYVMKHRFDDAIAEFSLPERTPTGTPAWGRGLSGYACAMAGRKREAEQMLEKIKNDLSRGDDVPIMLTYIGLGDKDRALACLERDYENHCTTMISLKSNPVYDPLRSDPRFIDLMRRVGLASGWNTPGEVVPEKSIAVIPFENLSDEKESTVFADGVQDDVLTKLAKVADLKVIGRTSVMQYRGKRDLRQIGLELGVSHVLEGTVRRSGEKVHVNAQLVDTRTGMDVWAEEYDRDLNEMFAIEADLAQSIVRQLRPNVSALETLAMQERPTADLVAYDLYTRAKNLDLAATFGDKVRGDYLFQAADLLNQAVTRDPSFFQAFCELARVHDRLYVRGYDHTAARLALAEAAVQTASRLRPDAGETHLARAENLYAGYLDYDGALAELQVARQSLPNDARVFQLMGRVQRLQGRWDESTRNLERALELSPRDLEMVRQIVISYDLLGRSAEEASLLDRALAIEPNHVEMKVLRASLDLGLKADTKPLHHVIDEIRARNPESVRGIASQWLVCALAERDAASATTALIAGGESPFSDMPTNRPFVEGLIARMTKDDQKARAAFAAARAEQEKVVQSQPNFGPPWCVLGLIDAALGRKEEALREGRRAVELNPVEKDAMRNPMMVEFLAMIAAWTGDKGLACEQLAIAVRPPSWIGYGDLKLLPWWDPLRGDPRFEKIVASLAPK